jgi:dihydrodipicolinate synthase/N-acetylneuraminate lyase
MHPAYGAPARKTASTRLRQYNVQKFTRQNVTPNNFTALSRRPDLLGIKKAIPYDRLINTANHIPKWRPYLPVKTYRGKCPMHE